MEGIEHLVALRIWRRHRFDSKSEGVAVEQLEAQVAYFAIQVRMLDVESVATRLGLEFSEAEEQLAQSVAEWIRVS